MTSISDVHDALMDGYDTDSLSRLLLFEFGSGLDTYTGASGFEQAAADVIRKFERQGELSDLITAMQLDNPKNEKVAQLGFSSMNTGKGRIPGAIGDISEDVYKLRVAVFGSKDLGTDGIMAQLKAIEKKLESLSAEFTSMQNDIAAVTRTIEPKTAASKLTSAVTWLVLLVTISSLAMMVVLYTSG